MEISFYLCSPSFRQQHLFLCYIKVYRIAEHFRGRNIPHFYCFRTICESFFCKICGCAYIIIGPEQFTKVFSAKFSFCTEMRKFSPSKIINLWYLVKPLRENLTWISPSPHLYSGIALIKSFLPSLTHVELETDNILVKIHLFLVFSAVSKHSAEGLRATMHALDCYKVNTTCVVELK